MMVDNKTTRLANFLRSLPKGTILYSPLCGCVRVMEVNASGILVELPDNNDPALPDTLLYRDNGHLANHESNTGKKYQIFPSCICLNWRVLRFRKGEIIVMEYKYKDGNVAKYTMIYDGVGVAYERCCILAQYAVYGNLDTLIDHHEFSFQPVHFDEQELSFRYANHDEAMHFLTVLKTCCDDKKAQALVAAHLQGIKFLEHLNNETANYSNGSL